MKKQYILYFHRKVRYANNRIKLVFSFFLFFYLFSYFTLPLRIEPKMSEVFTPTQIRHLLLPKQSLKHLQLASV